MRFASAVVIAAEPDARNVEFGYHPVLSVTIGSSSPWSAATEASSKPAPARSRRTIAGVAHVGPSDATE